MDKNQSNIVERMAELMEPVQRQLMMCDDRNDVLMMACAMMTTAKDIFDNELGQDGRKKMFKDFV
jgi:hypothetical protein|tara:strand:+ start:309 stop:503 length:195 start_codon:yes stop_codon:yes gene_type:complete